MVSSKDSPSPPGPNDFINILSVFSLVITILLKIGKIRCLKNLPTLLFTENGSRPKSVKVCWFLRAEHTHMLDKPVIASDTFAENSFEPKSTSCRRTVRAGLKAVSFHLQHSLAPDKPNDPNMRDEKRSPSSVTSPPTTSA
jgi:hypothetical protein